MEQASVDDFDAVVELGTDIEPQRVENPIPEDVSVHDTCDDCLLFVDATGWVSGAEVYQ